eukprot:594726-Amorphochlora_amoeboformis.AAC.2
MIELTGLSGIKGKTSPAYQADAAASASGATLCPLLPHRAYENLSYSIRKCVVKCTCRGEIITNREVVGLEERFVVRSASSMAPWMLVNALFLQLAGEY